MFWDSSTGSFQQDSEYNMGTDLEILPAPGTYPMMIFESCQALCNGPGTFEAFATVTDSVATPEPSLLACRFVVACSVRSIACARASSYQLPRLRWNRNYLNKIGPRVHL